MINLVILLGQLGRDPELRHSKAGYPVVSMSIATERIVEDQEGTEQKETEWHDVIAWHQLAEACNTYLKEGSLVYIQGRLHTRDWQDEQHITHRRTEVIAEEVKFLDRSSRTTRPGVVPDENLPF